MKKPNRRTGGPSPRSESPSSPEGTWIKALTNFGAAFEDARRRCPNLQNFMVFAVEDHRQSLTGPPLLPGSPTFVQPPRGSPRRVFGFYPGISMGGPFSQSQHTLGKKSRGVQRTLHYLSGFFLDTDNPWADLRALDEFQRLSAQAWSCLPEVVQRSLAVDQYLDPTGAASSAPWKNWLLALYAMAWNHSPESGLSAPRCVGLMNGEEEVNIDLERLIRLPDPVPVTAGPDGSALHTRPKSEEVAEFIALFAAGLGEDCARAVSEIKIPPATFHAFLAPDVFLASKLAVDLLVARESSLMISTEHRNAPSMNSHQTESEIQDGTAGDRVLTPRARRSLEDLRNRWSESSRLYRGARLSLCIVPASEGSGLMVDGEDAWEIFTGASFRVRRNGLWWCFRFDDQAGEVSFRDFGQLAVETGTVLQIEPDDPHVANVLPDTAWLVRLFELAWKETPGSPLRTHNLLRHASGTWFLPFPYQKPPLAWFQSDFGRTDPFIASAMAIDLILPLKSREDERGDKVGEPLEPIGLPASPVQPLHADQYSILTVLAARPRDCMTVNRVSSIGTIRNRETVGRLLRELARFGLVHRPHGLRKGYAITSDGIARANEKPMT